MTDKKPLRSIPKLTDELTTKFLTESEWIKSNFEEDQIPDLVACFLKNEPSDGYEFMHDLTSCPYFWDGDLDTANNLEEVIDVAQRSYREFLKNWAQENGIKPQYKAGDEIPERGLYIQAVSSYYPLSYEVQFLEGAPAKGSDAYCRLQFDRVEEGWTI